MKKCLLLTLFLFVVGLISVNAAKRPKKEYHRPSLHLVLISSDEPTCDDTTLIPIVAEAWNSYELPTLYNDFKIAFNEVKAGRVKGSFMELLKQYGDPSAFANLTLEQLKELKVLLDGKGYLEELKKYTDSCANEVAHQLIRKWWCIQDDGQWSDTLISRLACYSATQNAVSDARQTSEGVVSLMSKLADATIATTFVAFSKLGFYENEPLAKFTYNLTMKIAELSGVPLALVELGAKKAYEAIKDGYSAYSNTILYKLEWNDSIANLFYSCWDGNRVNMQKFNAMSFPMKCLGVDKASATTSMTKKNKELGVDGLVIKTIHKNMNKQIVKLQNSYEEFKPMVPILEVNVDGKYMLADMGTKESITQKDKFDVLMPITDENGITTYKKLGVVGVVKGGIWDNEEISNDELSGDEILGTKLTLFKDATPGLLVKKQKAKK